eukprot:GFUD01014733.1.p1 GENE.GFUD01014733.1~~GFUD01014733.1.p1  ORF type:complete len:444 (+),score=180.39 GFUD01014733.1:71-1402(+)
MGFVLSKFRKKKSTLEVLEQLELDIDNISKFKASTVVWQKKVVGYLVTYSIVVYLLLAMLVYFKLFPAAMTRQEQLLLLLPFLVFPGLIWGLRKLLTWWYHRKVRRDDMKLEQLKEKKVKILDEVKEKETYKVAKQILDRFGQNQSGVRPGAQLAGAGRQVAAGGGGHAGDDQLRRRAAPAMNTSLPASASYTASTAKQNTSLAISNTARPGGRAHSPAGRAGHGPGAPQGPSGAGGAAAPLLPPGRPAGAGGLSRSAPGPPLPRPVLPRERGYLDKFVEFLVGDGPANRFALICRQCQSHNGMALREEFEYVAYRCCYCYYWNPARKQRPVAPRLPDQASLPSASDSSGSDVSAASSAVQSRREKDKGDRVTVTGEQLSDTTDIKADNEHINQGDDCEVENEVMITSGIEDMGEKLDVKHTVEKAEYEIKEGGDECNNMEVE